STRAMPCARYQRCQGRQLTRRPQPKQLTLPMQPTDEMRLTRDSQLTYEMQPRRATQLRRGMLLTQLTQPTRVMQPMHRAPLLLALRVCAMRAWFSSLRLLGRLRHATGHTVFATAVAECLRSAPRWQWSVSLCWPRWSR